VSGVKATT